MIRQVGESIGRAILDGIGRAASRIQEQKSLPVDLLESDEAYLAIFDAPGTMASDVQVNFEGNTLKVRIDRFREFHEDYEMRFPGRGVTLGGEVALPEGASVDATGAEATVRQNGTLEVLIPKRGANRGTDSDSDSDSNSDSDSDSDSDADAGADIHEGEHDRASDET
jgi:HSP20 family molecular chaperone IbpA